MVALTALLLVVGLRLLHQKALCSVSLPMPSFLKNFNQYAMQYLQQFSVIPSWLRASCFFGVFIFTLWLIELLLTTFLGDLGVLIFSWFALYLGIQPWLTDTQQTKQIFIDAHEQSFGVLFWYLLLGPIGALAYRMLAFLKQYCATYETLDNLQQTSSTMHALAAWIPARITGFIYALVGNFNTGFACWQNAMQSTMLSSQVLMDCGHAAIEGNTQFSAAILVERAFYAWVLLISLLLVILC